MLLIYIFVKLILLTEIGQIFQEILPFHTTPSFCVQGDIILTT